MTCCLKRNNRSSAIFITHHLKEQLPQNAKIINGFVINPVTLFGLFDKHSIDSALPLVISFVFCPANKNNINNL